MLKPLIFTSISFAALAVALPNVRRQDSSSSSSSKIVWGECSYPWDAGVPVSCATLEVPLDYTDDTNAETLQLDLIKVAASKEPVLGSMLINPGGPGSSGVKAVVDNTQDFQIVAGGQYNIIGFDPRGTGRTIPYNCTSGYAGLAVEKRDDGKLLQTIDPNQIAESKWESYLQQAEACKVAHAANGNFYGTAFVVRDMVQILDALGEDGLLRYYGASYGTLLGWTFASMFPERVERMILDGNINPTEYWAGIDTESSSAADSTLKNLIDACVAHPEACTLASVGNTNEIVKQLNEVLVTMSTPDSGYPLSALDFKGYIFAKLYNPLEYPLAADSIYAAIQQNYTALEGLSADVPMSSLRPILRPRDESAAADVEPWNKQELTVMGVTCSDWPLRVTEASELGGLIEMQVSVGGSQVDHVGSGSFGCYVWPFEAAERYNESDVHTATKNPVLLVNPTWDPITPLVSAKNASATLPGSVVLEHRGNGHCTAAQPGRCVMQAMRDYMVEGTLPEEGSVCEPDMELFEVDEENVLGWKEEVFGELIRAAGAVTYGNGTKDGEGEGASAGNGSSSGSAQESNGGMAGIGRIGGEVLSVGVVGMVLMVL